MSKAVVEEFIWKNASTTAKDFRSRGFYKVFIEPNLRGKPMMGEKYLWPAEYLEKPDDEVIPMFARKNIHVIVVGGEVSPMMQAWYMTYPSTVSVDKWR